jgi:hypothetical protein
VCVYVCAHACASMRVCVYVLMPEAAGEVGARNVPPLVTRYCLSAGKYALRLLSSPAALYHRPTDSECAHTYVYV